MSLPADDEIEIVCNNLLETVKELINTLHLFKVCQRTIGLYELLFSFLTSVEMSLRILFFLFL